VRIGLLSDVHANLFALRAAIDRLTAVGVDAWVCAGDLVGYGPQPNECVETVAALDPICVAGNHELLVLDRIAGDRAGRRALISLAWTRDVLRDDVRAYLTALPLVASGPSMVVAHGSLGDPEEYVRADGKASTQLRRLAVEHPAERLLVLGHTHHQWLFGSERGSILHKASGSASLPGPERYLVNPGSVGQSRDRERRPRARFGLIDLDRAVLQFFAEPYDHDACRRALWDNGLPVDSSHLRPGRVAAVSRRARRLLQRGGQAFRAPNEVTRES
jgi:predicted phosphodiesterase